MLRIQLYESKTYLIYIKIEYLQETTEIDKKFCIKAMEHNFVCNKSVFVWLFPGGLPR